jgi:hypothetical protein
MEENQMRGVCSAHGLRNAYKILIRQSEGRNHFGQSVSRADFIKMYVEAVECGDVDWIYLAQDGI